MSENSFRSKFEILETIFNTINHILIGFVSIYMTYLCFKVGWTSLLTLHVFLCTLGYQLLMAEGILTLYSNNGWTKSMNKFQKTTIHWIIQIIGSGISIAGISIRINSKEGNHFQSVHAITGLISLIFLIITCLNGLTALFQTNLRKIVKPVFLRLFHYLFALFAFVVGMVSLNYGLEKNFIISNSDKTISLLLQIFSGITVGLCMPGPLINIYGLIKGMVDS